MRRDSGGLRMLEGVDRYLSAFRDELAAAIRSVLRTPAARRPRKLVRMSPRHNWEWRDSMVVEPFAARSYARFAQARDSTRVVDLGAILYDEPALWKSVAGRRKLEASAHAISMVGSHLTLLTERYFRQRPHQQAFSSRLVDELMAGYAD